MDEFDRETELLTNRFDDDSWNRSVVLTNKIKSYNSFLEKMNSLWSQMQRLKGLLKSSLDSYELDNSFESNDEDSNNINLINELINEENNYF